MTSALNGHGIGLVLLVLLANHFKSSGSQIFLLQILPNQKLIESTIMLIYIIIYKSQPKHIIVH